MEDLYIPNCCISKLLPALLRKTEGRTAIFYSQGDWGMNKLWNSVSHMVSTTIQTADGQIEGTGGKIQMMLVIPTLDVNMMQLVAEYYNRGWFDNIMIVAYSVTMRPETVVQYKNEMSNALHLVIGRREAQRQSFWLRWDDVTYNALLVAGPMYSRDTNNSFGMYSAAFHDRKDEGENHAGRELVEMVRRPWLHIVHVSDMKK